MNTPLDIAQQALRDILDPIGYMERSLEEGYRLDGHAALRHMNTREFYVRLAREALAAIEASAPAPAADERQDIGGYNRAAAAAKVQQQADDDTKRLDYLQKKQATISLVNDGRDEAGTRHAFMVGGWHCSVNRDIRAAIDAAMSA